MRVLHISTGNLYGGVERTLVTLARYRDQFPGIDLHFTVCFEGRLSAELRTTGAPVHNLGTVRIRNPISVWKARTKLRDLLSDLQYDVVISHCAWSQAIFGPVVKAERIPLLFWLHGAPSGRHWLERWAARIRPDGAICCSKFTANLLWKLYREVPNAVVYPPLALTRDPASDSSQRLATRKEFDTPSDAVVIVQVSRMEPWKGHWQLIEALASMQDEPNWVCWFVGGPQHSAEVGYWKRIQTAAVEYGIAHRVRFLGQRTDIERLLGVADIFCQPNTHPEPFGQVFVEALSAGLPVITTATGGALEIVDSSCGVLTPPNDVSALANALRRLATDSQLRKRMSDRAPARALELCEPSQQLQRIAGAIENTIRRARTPMRVLQICSGNLYGGVETIQVTLARHRDQCPEIELHFAVCFEGRLSAELAASGVPVHDLGAVRVRNPISVWRARARLRKLLSEFQYDAAICYSAWTQAIFGPVIQKMKVQLLYWLQGAPSGRHWLERWARLTQPDEVMCCSEYTSSLLWKLYPGVPSEVVYAPVPPIMKQPEDSMQRLTTRKELETPADAVVIVQVSRMEAWKGHRFHVEALAKMRDLAGWVCWIVGGPQRPEEARYFQELQATAKQYGIADRLRFLGQRSDVQRLLAAADLFCQPNTGPEPFGVVFVEALWAGLPVITTATGGGLEIVDSSCGVLTPPNDVTALATALQRLVTDSELRLRMSNAAPARARELCESSQQLKQLARVIENTVARGRAA